MSLLRDDSGFTTISYEVTDANSQLQRLTFSIERDATGNCLNSSTSAFDATTCPTEIEVSSTTGTFSFQLLGSIFTHNEFYTVTATAYHANGATVQSTSNHRWKQEAGSLVREVTFDTGASDWGRRIRVDQNSNNFYIAGIGMNYVSGSSNVDQWMVKYNHAGDVGTDNAWAGAPHYLAWHSTGTQQDRLYGLVIDGNGKVYYNGHSEESGTDRNWVVRSVLEDGTVSDILTSDVDNFNNLYRDMAEYNNEVYTCGFNNSSGEEDIIVQKFVNEVPSTLIDYDADGGGVQNDKCEALHVDASGVYIAGSRTNTNIIYIARFELNGTLDWIQDIAGLTYAGGSEKMTLVRGGDNLYLAGFQNTGNNDWFIRVYDLTGSTVASLDQDVDGGETDNDETRGAMWHSASNSLFVVGFGTNIVNTGASGQDAWLKRFRSDGSEDTSWEIQYDHSNGQDIFADVDSDPTGDIYVIGYSTNYVGGGTGADTIVKIYSAPSD